VAGGFDDNDATQTQTEISGQDNEGHLEKSSKLGQESKSVPTQLPARFN
jgi:hypothetical protein